ncbi:MAG: hypothetical protein Q4D90_11150, partial [bacterium]|nr:hypothetical protein [bacterium]
MIQGLTAADNVFLIRKGYRGFFINDSLIQRQLKKLGQDMEIEIRAGKRVREMTDLEKYVIEIVKAYIGKADIVILQDIGSSLHIEDMGKIEKVIRYYAEKGLSFIYISARTEELNRLCDRVSVMSHGRIIKVLEQNKMKESLEKYYFFPHQPAETNGTNTRKEGEKIFRCENLCYKSIQNLSFDVERGECLLVRDLNKFDWGDFISVLSGAKLQQGMVWRGYGRGRKVRRKTAVILENPTETMLFPEMSCEDNLCLTLDHRIGRLWWSKKKRKNIAREIFGREVARKVKDLSLKEKYELVYYRILLQTPDIVFCFFPYRNVDRETHQFTNEFLKKFLSKNIAVV